MDPVDTGRQPEQLTSHMARRAVAGRREVDLAGISFGVSDELRDCPGGDRRMHLHYEGTADKASDSGDIANEIEIEVFVERCVDGIRNTDQEQRVSVR